MLIYYFFFFLLVLTAYFEVFTQKRNYILFACVIFFLVILVGIRFNVGTDWPRYLDHYNDVKSLSDLRFSDYVVEPLFVLSLSICKTLGFNYQFTFSLLSFISISVLLSFFKKVGFYVALPFLIYYGLHFLPYQMNIVRHGIMASFVMLSLIYVRDGKFGKYCFCIICGSLFQSIAFFFLPFYYVLNRIYTAKLFFAILLGFFFLSVMVDLFSVLLSMSFFQQKVYHYIFDYYSDIDEATTGFSLGTLFSLILLLFMRFYFFKNEYLAKVGGINIYINTLLCSVLFVFMFNKLGILEERTVGVYNISIPILLSALFCKYKKKRIFIFLFVILYSFMMLSANLRINNETKINQFVPYNYRL